MAQWRRLLGYALFGHSLLMCAYLLAETRVTASAVFALETGAAATSWAADGKPLIAEDAGLLRHSLNLTKRVSLLKNLPALLGLSLLFPGLSLLFPGHRITYHGTRHQNVGALLMSGLAVSDVDTIT